MQTSRIARCVLTDIIASITLLLIGFSLNQRSHIPNAILFIQILAVGLFAQAYPISTLKNEQTKLTKTRTKHIQIEIITFGILASLISYGSYLLFFGYHILSPVYIDTTSSLYMQATTVTLITLALCQTINLFFVRTDKHQPVLSDFLFENKRLVRAYGLSFILILNIVYNPWFHSLFHTASIGVVGWAGAIVCAGVYTLIRRFQNYTNKHSRHEVVKLHKEVHSA